jgi:membrane protein required for colicin V production
MPFQLLDLILAGIMLISGLLALMRGFTREVLSLVAWAAAALAAYLAIQQPKLLDFAMQYFDKELFAKIAVGAAAFIVILIIVSLISVKVSDMVVDSAAGVFDRSLGFLYGLARGLVLVAIAYLFYGWLNPVEKQADWVRNARSLPILKEIGGALLSFMPQDIADTLQNTALMGNPEQPKPPQPGEPGYQSTDQQGLDNLTQGIDKQQPGFGQSNQQ